MIRRLFTALLLSMALLSGQQQAYAHALTHAHPATAHDEQAQPSGHGCAKCVALAHLGAGAPSRCDAGAVPPPRGAVRTLYRLHFGAGPTFFYLSCGPPRQA